ncbi:MAG TPA: response regulator [Devosia sp.]|nr:response regulator [Devosia sp.]
MARDPYKYFRIEARQLIDQLNQSLMEVERAGAGGDVVPRLLRLAHTLKGASRVVRQPEIADKAHSIEDLLSPFREGAGSVPRDKMDALLALLDGITERVANLKAPEAEAAPSVQPTAPAAPAAPVAAAPVTHAFAAADISEIDALYDGVGETYAQLSGLGEAEKLAANARRLSTQLFQSLQAVQGTGNGLLELARQLQGLTSGIERGVADTHERIAREISEVRETVEQLRLAPVTTAFPYLERAGRDSAQALGKLVRFEMQATDIRLDAGVLRVAQDALSQLIRNAVAHGVETPAERSAAGKSTQGRIAIAVSRRGRQIVFRCEDDGHGIDVPKLVAAAATKGATVPMPAEGDARALARLLLRGGVSTSETVTEVAGRGIGMDIVRDAVARLGGELLVETTPGRGTVFELIAPQSISAVEALLIESGDAMVTLPLHAVRHAMRIEARDIHRTAATEAILHNGQSIPLVRVSRLLGKPSPPRRAGSFSVIVVRGGDGLAAIDAGRVRGTANVVLRALPPLAPAARVVAGASLDAGGRPLLMLDPEGIVAVALGAIEPARAEAEIKLPLLVIDDSLTTRMLEQSILESAGYQVDLATSAEEGLERARRGNYALILCDVEMPGMDGFGFVEEIRRDPQLRNTPAILVTSRNAPEDKRRGKAVGAQGYVVKSEFDQAELLDHIRRLVA